MAFRNQQAFDDPASRLAAMGSDLRRSTAITDPQGGVLAYARSGGIIAPSRHEIPEGATLFRFGSRRLGVARAASGAWWLERTAIDRIVRFAQEWGLSDSMAMRMLCLVPPEWSDASLLIRARAVAPLLAWRGLANSVVTPARGGGPAVRMPHQNDIAARRLHQLFIPGLADDARAHSALLIEQAYPLDPTEATRGFLYL